MIRELYWTVRMAVSLVPEMEKRVDAESVFLLKSAVLGLMHVYASQTGKPKPTIVAREVYEALVVRELAESANV